MIRGSDPSIAALAAGVVVALFALMRGSAEAAETSAPASEIA
ncbi:MAG: hypothetical protein ABSH45_21430 [Bryobacteraceae bacterium]